jgi:hypothetical protein
LERRAKNEFDKIGTMGTQVCIYLEEMSGGCHGT